MTAPTEERPPCPYNAWCVLGIGHDDGCSILRKSDIDGLRAMAAEISNQLEMLKASWKAFVRAVNEDRDKTPKEPTDAA